MKKFITCACIASALLAAMLALCLYILALELRNAKARTLAAEEENAALSMQIREAESNVDLLRAEVEVLNEKNDELLESLWLQKKLAALPRLQNVSVSHYCCELYEHICGTGDGLTASGVPVQAGVSVAVDPEIIPLGSTVFVDYGDGNIHTYTAHDVGGYIKGKHIDVAVETHDMAVAMGLRTANIWWEENK